MHSLTPIPPCRARFTTAHRRRPLKTANDRREPARHRSRPLAAAEVGRKPGRTVLPFCPPDVDHARKRHDLRVPTTDDEARDSVAELCDDGAIGAAPVDWDRVAELGERIAAAARAAADRG
jgi:hypothetical protein